MKHPPPLIIVTFMSYFDSSNCYQHYLPS